MKLQLLGSFFIFSFFTCSAFAQTAIPEFKKFSLSAIEGNHLDLTITKLPIGILVDALEKSATAPTKGEFESTAAYEARKGALPPASIINDLKINDTFATAVPVQRSRSTIFNYKYNPDTDELNFFVLLAG